MHPRKASDELLDCLADLPPPDQIKLMVSQLRAGFLREMSAEVISGSIVYLRGGDRLTFIRLVASWIATAQETVAAGRELRQILARRMKKPS